MRIKELFKTLWLKGLKILLCPTYCLLKLIVDRTIDISGGMLIKLKYIWQILRI